ANRVEQAGRIVGAYLRRNPVPAEELPGVISAVHHALANLGTPTEPVEAERTPAVPIRRSVQRDFVVCLECGWRGRILRSHIGAIHDLSVEQYRSRWNLRPEHVLVAPSYSERRSGMAKQLGLGRRPTETSDAPAPTTPESPLPAQPR